MHAVSRADLPIVKKVVKLCCTVRSRYNRPSKRSSRSSSEAGWAVLQCVGVEVRHRGVEVRHRGNMAWYGIHQSSSISFDSSSCASSSTHLFGRRLKSSQFITTILQYATSKMVFDRIHNTNLCVSMINEAGQKDSKVYTHNENVYPTFFGKGLNAILPCFQSGRLVLSKQLWPTLDKQYKF